MPDYAAAELAIGAGATVAVSTFLFLMLQAVKDWFPDIAGRRALGVLYGLSLLIALALVAQSSPDWADYATYLSLVIVTVSVSVVAKGIYAQLFKVSVEALPPSPDIEVPVEALRADREAMYRRERAQRTDEHPLPQHIPTPG